MTSIFSPDNPSALGPMYRDIGNAIYPKNRRTKAQSELIAYKARSAFFVKLREVEST